MRLAGHSVDIGNHNDKGARKDQEDYFAFAPDGTDDLQGLTMVLADGMGGQAGGDAASVIAVDAFIRQWRSMTPVARMGDARASLKDCVWKAHEAISAARGESRMGTTMIALYIEPSGLHWASAGDSVILRIRRGKITRLNKDHNLGQELDRATAVGIVTPSDAADRRKERHKLTSFLGGPQLNFLDIQDSVAWLPGDIYLLASDGLTDAMSLPEIAQVARESGSSRELCEELIDAVLAKRRPKQDNTSVVALKIGESDGEPTATRTGGDSPRRTNWVAIALAIVWCATIAIGAVLWPREPSTGRERPKVAPQQGVDKHGAEDATVAVRTPKRPTAPARPARALECPRPGKPSMAIWLDVRWSWKKRHTAKTMGFELLDTKALDAFLKHIGRCSGTHNYRIVAFGPTLQETATKKPYSPERTVRGHVSRALKKMKMVFKPLPGRLGRRPMTYTMPLIVQASGREDEENQ